MASWISWTARVSLISYTTENELLGKVTNFLRPRLIGYAVAMVAMVGAFTTFLVLRSPIELSIERDRGQLFSESKAGDIVNDFQISILNKKPITMRYELAILGRPGAQLVAPEIIEVASGERITLAIQVEMAPEQVVQPRLPFTVEVRSLESNPGALCAEQYIYRTQTMIKPWYKEPWPWFFIAPIATSVCVGMFMLRMSIVTSDGLVSDDYYKEGRAYNKTLNEMKWPLSYRRKPSSVSTMSRATSTSAWPVTSQPFRKIDT